MDNDAHDFYDVTGTDKEYNDVEVALTSDIDLSREEDHDSNLR